MEEPDPPVHTHCRCTVPWPQLPQLQGQLPERLPQGAGSVQVALHPPGATVSMYARVLVDNDLACAACWRGKSISKPTRESVGNLFVPVQAVVALVATETTRNSSSLFGPANVSYQQYNTIHEGDIFRGRLVGCSKEVI